MDPFSVKTTSIAFGVASFLAYRSLKKQSLTKDGAITGFIVGLLLVSTGLRGMVLFYFYQLGSWATKYKQQIKSTYDTTVVQSSQRGSKQVLAVSIVSVLFSLYHVYRFGREQPINFTIKKDDNMLSLVTTITPSTIACAVLAHHATGLADTFASELGILTPQQPVLITQPWKHVPRGTNGGVTLAGFVWSTFGGAIIGILTVFMDYLSGIEPLNSMFVILFGGVCGFIGSIIDSLLGATVQVTYYDVDTKQVLKYDNDSNTALPPTAKHICGINCLSNEQVNFFSMLITSLIGGWIIGPSLFRLCT